MTKKGVGIDRQKGLFKQEVPKMPEGYYSGDQPNPNLGAFVEAHIKENPYDPETDDYDVPAFDMPIESTKATAIYNMHTYWSKKPHGAIRQYIKHYTKPGDLVLDPFCGSGGTALAALMEDRKAIAIDRSPAATFITKNYCTPVDLDELREAFEDLEQKVKPEIDWLYETRCDRCGGKAVTAYTVYSQIFQCPRCLEKIPLFDCLDEKGKTAKGKPKKIKACPYCHEKGIIEEISTRGEKFGAIPVLVSYLCEGACKPKRDQRRYNDPDLKKRMYFEKYDIEKISEIKERDIPYWYPKNNMMNAPADQERWGVKWRKGTSNFRTVDELFTKRNLWALAAVLKAIRSLSTNNDPLLFTFTSNLLKSSKMMAHNNDGIGRIQKGTYYIPQLIHDINVWRFMIEGHGDMIAGYSSIDRLCPKMQISTSDARKIDIPDDSVDFIFTDPSYADKVQYGELNFVWEAWLSLDTLWHEDEIVVNEVRGRTEADWAIMLKSAFAECLRVLKPDRTLSLCYHDTSEGTWASVQDIMAEIGFITENTDSAHFIDTKTKTTNQYFADKVNKRDLVINFRKPKPGESRHGISFTGDEDDQTFSQKVLAIIRKYLNERPGSTKDRIFDTLASRLVRKGQMEAHDFEALLGQVADSVVEPRMKDLFTPMQPDLFGENEIKRWYLKDSEEGADESDQVVADATAKKIENFMEKQCAIELQKSQLTWDKLKKEIDTLYVKLAEISMEINDQDEKTAHRAKRERPKLKRELTRLENERKKLEIKRSEWKQNALHYTYVSEFYFPLQPKPRCQLTELLEDYFYFTEQGNWRPPATNEEHAEKQAKRALAVRRRLQRYCRTLESGDLLPRDQHPDDYTLVEWIRYCKRVGLYGQGKLLYERGGLNMDNLPDDILAAVEEDYQVCMRMLGRNKK